MSKRIAVLNITSRCNLRCPFCFGPETSFAQAPRHEGGVSASLRKACGYQKETVAAPFKVRNLRRLPAMKAGSPLRSEKSAAIRRELTTAQAKNLILKLKKIGVRTLIFSGGEPLLRKDIWELICFAKNLGFFTVLHTNGVLLCKKVWQKLNVVAAPFKVRNLRRLPAMKAGSPLRSEKPAATKLKLCLDQINLPIDGYNAKTNDAMRGKGHFRAVMSGLQMLKNKKIRVIISTVATKSNKEAVAKIGRILPKWVFKWRVFQFNPQGKAAKVKREFYLSDEEFERIRKEIYRLKPKLRNIKVQCISLKDKFWESYEVI